MFKLPKPQLTKNLMLKKSRKYNTIMFNIKEKPVWLDLRVSKIFKKLKSSIV